MTFNALSCHANIHLMEHLKGDVCFVSTMIQQRKSLCHTKRCPYTFFMLQIFMHRFFMLNTTNNNNKGAVFRQALGLSGLLIQSITLANLSRFVFLQLNPRDRQEDPISKIAFELDSIKDEDLLKYLFLSDLGGTSRQLACLRQNTASFMEQQPWLPAEGGIIINPKTKLLFECLRQVYERDHVCKKNLHLILKR